MKRTRWALWLLEPVPLRWTLGGVTALFLIYLFVGLRSAELNAPWKIDEGQRIAEGYAWRLLTNLEPGDRDWFRTAATRSHPPVAKYVFGASVELAGVEAPRDLELTEAYERGAGAATMPVKFATEYQPRLRPARIASFVFNLLTAVTVFGVLLRLQGLGTAVLSQGLLFRHYLFVHALFYARSDTIQTFFAVSTVVPLLLCLHVSRLSRAVPAALLAGTLAALSFQTRLNGGVALIMCLAFLLAGVPIRKRTALLGATVVAAFVVVSIGVNPYYWATPALFAELPATLTEPQALPLRIARRFEIQVHDLVTLSAGVPVEWHMNSFRERLPFTASVLGSGKAGWITMAGLVLALGLALSRRGGTTERALVAWAVSGLLVMAFWIPLRWDVYLLIVLPSSILVASSGIGLLLRKAADRLRPA